jgi:hypothetical protein
LRCDVDSLVAVAIQAAAGRPEADGFPIDEEPIAIGSADVAYEAAGHSFEVERLAEMEDAEDAVRPGGMRDPTGGP